MQDGNGDGKNIILIIFNIYAYFLGSLFCLFKIVFLQGVALEEGDVTRERRNAARIHGDAAADYAAGEYDNAAGEYDNAAGKYKYAGFRKPIPIGNVQSIGVREFHGRGVCV